MADSDTEDESLAIFEDPDGFYRPEKEPTVVKHRMLDGSELTLHLVGHNPLWGHLLWQAGRTLADYIETNKTELAQDKTVLELGAGAGLPSLICALSGARQVVVTDYPDAELVANLQRNIAHCSQIPQPPNICAEGYLWGASAEGISKHLPADEQGAGFDVLILADVLFNHSEHSKLLASVQQNMKRACEAKALVFFSPYRPWLLEKDLAFFDLARAGGFVVEKILEKVMDKVMFEEDPGDEMLRRTVFGYRLTWADVACRS